MIDENFFLNISYNVNFLLDIVWLLGKERGLLLLYILWFIFEKEYYV